VLNYSLLKIIVLINTNYNIIRTMFHFRRERNNIKKYTPIKKDVSYLSLYFNRTITMKFDKIGNEYTKITMPVIGYSVEDILSCIPKKLIDKVKATNEVIYYDTRSVVETDLELSSCLLFIPKIININDINFLSEFNKKINDMKIDDMKTNEGNLVDLYSEDTIDSCISLPIFAHNSVYRTPSFGLYDAVNQIIMNNDVDIKKLSFTYDKNYYKDNSFDDVDNINKIWYMNYITLFDQFRETKNALFDGFYETKNALFDGFYETKNALFDGFYDNNIINKKKEYDVWTNNIDKIIIDKNTGDTIKVI